MIKPIMKSEFFLRLPSEDAGPDDAATGQDLLDTLHEHERECVGLAANMIGVRKRIICVKDGNRTLLMYNPQILEQVNAYQTSEGCLSLIGERPCTRYRRIKVEYLDENFVHRIKNFSGYTAEIIQHEIDHCNGIVFVDQIRDDHDAFYRLNAEGELDPLDYDTYVKDNSDLWG